MHTARFTHRNEEFECAHCGAHVLPSTLSCRNHCPFCLYSIHVDKFPGDRAANCGGLMEPVRIDAHSKKGYQVVHRCLQCGMEKKNTIQLENGAQPDSFDVVLELMRNPK